MFAEVPWSPLTEGSAFAEMPLSSLTDWLVIAEVPQSSSTPEDDWMLAGFTPKVTNDVKLLAIWIRQTWHL